MFALKELREKGFEIIDLSFLLSDAGKIINHYGVVNLQ
jgi:hypothetical protein